MAKAAKEPKPKKEPKAPKKTLASIPMGANLKNYLRLLTVMAPLKGLEATLRQALEEEARTKILEQGHDNKVRPENFIGVCDKGTAEFQLQKRAKNSPLTEDEVKVLKEIGIPFENTEVKPKSIQINPKVINDIDVVNMIAAAIQNSPETLELLKEKGIDSQDIFHHEDAVKKDIVSDATLDAAFALVDLQRMFSVVNIATRFMVSPSPLADNDYNEALNVLTETGVAKSK